MEPVASQNSPHFLELDDLKIASQREVLTRLEGMRRSVFGSQSAIEELKTYKGEEINLILQHYFKNLVGQLKGDETIQLDTLIRALSLNGVLDKSLGINDLVEEAKEHFRQAQYYLDKSRGVPISTKAYLNCTIEAFILTVQGFIDAFGFGAVFSNSESDVHADFKSQKIIQLVGSFSMITQALVPAVGGEMTLKIFTGFFLSFTALSLIWKYIKPLPSTLPGGGESVNRDIQMGGFIPEGRDEVRDKIAKYLKKKRHVLLVAPSRTGKSAEIAAFTAAIERGVYPEFKGFQVYRHSTGEIAKENPSFLGGTSTILSDMRKATGRHEEKVIRVWDEFHMACKDKCPLGDRLKPYLDKNGHFQRVIAITTPDELQYIQKNVALLNRFKIIPLENTVKKNTIKIMRGELISDPKKPIVQDGVLEEIYKSCPKDAPQPFTALEELSVRVAELGDEAHSANREQLDNNNKKIGRKTARLLWKSEAKCKDLLAKIKALQTQNTQLEKNIKHHENPNTLFGLKQALDKATARAYETLLRWEKKGNDNQLKYYWVVTKYLIPALKSRVVEEANRLGIKMEITLKDFPPNPLSLDSEAQHSSQG